MPTDQTPPAAPDLERLAREAAYHVCEYVGDTCGNDVTCGVVVEAARIIGDVFRHDLARVRQLTAERDRYRAALETMSSELLLEVGMAEIVQARIARNDALAPPAGE
jgi:RNA polymerase-interacting CarD/CdnL/TRCF family regulator